GVYAGVFSRLPSRPERRAGESHEVRRSGRTGSRPGNMHRSGSDASGYAPQTGENVCAQSTLETQPSVSIRGLTAKVGWVIRTAGTDIHRDLRVGAHWSLHLDSLRRVIIHI